MNRQELYTYLDNFDFDSKKETTISSVYFLIRNGLHKPEPLYFMHYQGSWFESPCCLMKHQLDDDKVKEYVDEIYLDNEEKDEYYKFENLMQRDGWHYEIDCPQCLPFLENDIEILDVFTESECLNWLLKNE